MALSINDLRSFILVGTERSVTKAAAQLGVSQQSVSERIRRLERRVGAPLFDRLPFGMRLSVAGYRFLPYATQCVELIDQALDVVSDDDHLRIEVQRSVATAVMPMLKTLAETEQAKISLTDDTDTNSVISSLAAGVIDLAVGAFAGIPTPGSPRSARSQRSRDRNRLGPHAPSTSPEGAGADPSASEAKADDEVAVDPGPLEVVAEALFSDPVVWAAPPDHPLAQRSEPIALSELISALPNGANGAGTTQGGLQSSATSNGADLRVAARSLLASDLVAGRLVELPLDQPSWVVPISIAYRAVEEDRPAIRAVRTALVDGHKRSLTQPAPGGGTGDP